MLKARKEYEKVFHGSCIVLLYHRVTNLETDPQLLSVSPANFDAHLSLLQEKYHLLTVEEFQYHLEHNIRFPANSVLITFDDGYADNYLEALPILEKHHAQALFYVATGTLNSDREYWWDAMERIVLLSETQPAAERFELNEAFYDLKDLGKEKRLQLYEKLLPELRRKKSIERENKIAELAELFNALQSRPSHRAMTFEELRKMSLSSAAVIGAHTHFHPSLGALNYQEQFEEIETSKRLLENLLEKKISHFSYPFGTVNDFNKDTLEIVSKLNFELVAANFPYLVNKKTNKHSFPRFLVRNWDKAEFEKQLKSFRK